MEIEVSLPKDSFERISCCATDLGISRSEFVNRAVVSYFDTLDGAPLTRQIDASLEASGSDDETQHVAVAAGRKMALRR
jgi:metal-responsive CopG/Arc/MetJ family transcriptional regulator